MSVPLVCIALLVLLCLGLGFSVSMARAKSKVIIGQSTDPEDPLYQRVRAHANAVEYSPLLAILIYILGQTPQPMWVMAAIVLVTTCRYIHALGMLLPTTLAKPNLLRFVGALGTYVLGTLLAMTLLLQALT